MGKTFRESENYLRPPFTDSGGGPLQIIPHNFGKEKLILARRLLKLIYILTS